MLTIQKLGDALAHPQVAARGLIVESEHPAVGHLRQIALPVKFQHEAREAHRPPPLLGQHTDEILPGTWLQRGNDRVLAGGQLVAQSARTSI